MKLSLQRNRGGIDREEMAIDDILNTPLRMREKDILNAGNDVIIYGAGNAGRDVLRVLTAHGINPRCFIDRAAWGTSVEGIAVLRPEDGAITPDTRGKAWVVVAVFNPIADVSSIESNLESLGYRNIVSFVEFHGYFPDELGRRYWLVSPEFYRQRQEPINEASGIWADEKSKEIYLSTMNARLRNDYRMLLRPDPFERQYFPLDVPATARPTRFIDCGAFDGDTLKRLNEQYDRIQCIVALEPSPANFAELAGFVKKSRALADQIFLIPCGVWSSTTQLAFSERGAASSIFGGDSVIQCIALDDALRGLDPSHIKMDIEGAEYEAILGAREMIERSIPDLAVCLYHCPEHLWQIPLLIKGWNLGYRFYLRQYGHSGFDLVMYANKEVVSS